MIKRYSKSILLLSIFFFALLSFESVNKINADSGFPAGCQAPFGIPDACPTACKSQNDTNCYVPDFSCSNAKFLNPQTICCSNKCNGGGTIGTIDPGDASLIRSFNIFGTKFSFSSGSIPSLINAIISTFLGIVSIYALARGAYLGAVIRPGVTSSDDISKINKEIVNLIIGFILAWSFIFIIQFVATVLGIGNLNDLNVTNTGTEIVIT
ncbi:MAG: hypothetical protein ABI721_04015 [Candidatus Dojkabacteria bacterium]